MVLHIQSLCFIYSAPCPLKRRRLFSKRPQTNRAVVRSCVFGTRHRFLVLTNQTWKTSHCPPEAPIFMEKGPLWSFCSVPLFSKRGTWGPGRRRAITRPRLFDFPVWTFVCPSAPTPFCFAFPMALPSWLPPLFLCKHSCEVYLICFSALPAPCVSKIATGIHENVMSSDVYNPKESLTIFYNKTTWMSVFYVGKASQAHNAAITTQCIMYNLSCAPGAMVNRAMPSRLHGTISRIKRCPERSTIVVIRGQ